jgi:ATP-dependent protease ClpP protease subunit
MTFSVDKRDGKEDYCNWNLSGEIKKDDPSLADQLFKRDLIKCKQRNRDYINLYVDLNSNGGDVDAAMAIGRLLRKYGVRTVVRRGSKCLSSCVFLLMAGLERWVISDEVGVHRPFFTDLNSQTDINEIKNMRLKGIERIRTYLTEMDIPTSLLDLMMTTPPNEIKYLNLEERKNFGLYGADPSWDEKRNAILASYYGLTSSEYRKLNAIASQTCKNRDIDNPIMEDEASLCRWAVLLQVSIEKFSSKFPLAEKRCFVIKDAEQVMQCVRNIIQSP